MGAVQTEKLETKTVEVSAKRGRNGIFENRGLPVEDARRKFELPYDQDVQAELNLVQREQSRDSEIYAFSLPERSHDDKFWAIALACFSAIGSKGRGRLVRAF